MPRALYTNNALTTLIMGVGAAATTLEVADGSVFPTPTGGDYAYLTIADPVDSEIVRMTGRTGNTLTVVRGQDNTTVRTFASGASVSLRVVAALLNDVDAQVIALGSSLQADINTRATITQLATVESTLTGSIATLTTTLDAETTARTTAISGLQTDINTRATIVQLNSVESTLTGAIATVSTNLTAETNARTAADSTLTTAVNNRATITQLNSVESTLTGSIATVSTNLTAETNARISGDNTLTTAVNNRATITQLNTVETNLTSAVATVSTNLTAETNNRIAAVSTVASAVSTVDGKLNASYGITVDANGRIASLKLLSNGNTSEIAFTADTFRVFNGTNNQAVFSVSGGSVRINGGIIVSGSVVRGVFQSGEIAALSAEGLAANYYEQAGDPGSVPNGSIWFRTTTNELFIRRSNAWGKVATIAFAGLDFSWSTAFDKVLFGSGTITSDPVTFTGSGGSGSGYTYTHTLLTTFTTGPTVSLSGSSGSPITINSSSSSPGNQVRFIVQTTVTDSAGNKTTKLRSGFFLWEA